MENLGHFEILSMSRTPVSKIPYGVRMLGAHLEWNETRGKGIKIALLDTGCPRHKDIKNIANTFVSDGLRYSTDVWDKNGHATHVAGTLCANGQILGIAPEAELYPAKVLDDIGGGNDDTIAQGIEWAIEQKVNVINMSLGGIKPQPKTHQAIQRADQQGIKVVCAAGNAGESWMAYPAKFEETIAVAAVNPQRLWVDFSSTGEEVELCALGDEVFSCWLDNQYAILKGTSMACPHIAGAVSLFDAKCKIRFNRDRYSLDEIRTIMHAYAEDLGEIGKDRQYGYGLFSFGRFEVSEHIPEREIEMRIGSKLYRVNDEQKEMDIAPKVEHNRTFVPVRFVAEGLGAKVEWEPAGKPRQTILIRG